jgi:hypothetical protein
MHPRMHVQVHTAALDFACDFLFAGDASASRFWYLMKITEGHHAITKRVKDRMLEDH